MSRKVSDGMVRPRIILDCVLQLQRSGTTPAMLRLEQTEPDLAEYLLESLSSIHHDLHRLHGPPSKTRRLYRQISVMTLVCIEALRQSHYELWQQQTEGGDGPNESAQTESGVTEPEPDPI
jgi:hypothetical protein